MHQSSDIMIIEYTIRKWKTLWKVSPGWLEEVRRWEHAYIYISSPFLPFYTSWLLRRKGPFLSCNLDILRVYLNLGPKQPIELESYRQCSKCWALVELYYGVWIWIKHLAIFYYLSVYLYFPLIFKFSSHFSCSYFRTYF